MFMLARDTCRAICTQLDAAHTSDHQKVITFQGLPKGLQNSM